MILIPYINPEIDKTIYKLLQFFFVVIICWSVHQSAEIITTFSQKFTRRTKTELDDLLLPYVAKTIKIAAIIIILVKSAEVFLGMSAAALIGLLGGWESPWVLCSEILSPAGLDVLLSILTTFSVKVTGYNLMMVN